MNRASAGIAPMGRPLVGRAASVKNPSDMPKKRDSRRPGAITADTKATDSMLPNPLIRWPLNRPWVSYFSLFFPASLRNASRRCWNCFWKKARACGFFSFSSSSSAFSSAATAPGCSPVEASACASVSTNV